MIRNWVRRAFLGVALATTCVMGAGFAHADNLFGAMEKAYATNPTLNGARAGQRATDEQVPQALSGWRPDVSVNSSLTTSDTDRSNHVNSGQVNITLSQPLFRGFRTVEGTKAAEARVDAGRQNLLQTEQEVLFNVVQVYMDVYSGRQLVALQQQNVAALGGQLKASNERFNVGEITRTDVAQSRASLAQAKTLLVTAQANLQTSVATYLQLIGDEPGKLNYPKIANLPKSLKAALVIAGETNPQILAQAFVEAASQFDVKVVRGQLLPEASLIARAAVSDTFGDKRLVLRGGKPVSVGIDPLRSTEVVASLSVPIYANGGSVYSAVREAKQVASQRRIQVIEVARLVRQAVAEAWTAYVAYGDIITNARTEVSAAELALNGVQQEYQAGTRTTQDVLDAQSLLVTAKTKLVNAQKNKVVAGYQLLAAIGHLTAKDLNLNVAIYDPAENYNRVRDKWFGTDVETIE
jgi:outer membrane protein